MSGTTNSSKAKSSAKIADFKPAQKIKVDKPETRVYSVPAHVSSVITSSGCRFGG